MIIIQTIYAYTLNTALGTCHLGTYTLYSGVVAGFGSVTYQLIKRIISFFAFFCACADIIYFSDPVIFIFNFGKQWIVYIIVVFT